MSANPTQIQTGDWIVYFKQVTRVSLKIYSGTNGHPHYYNFRYQLDIYHSSQQYILPITLYTWIVYLQILVTNNILSSSDMLMLKYPVLIDFILLTMIRSTISGFRFVDCTGLLSQIYQYITIITNLQLENRRYSSKRILQYKYTVYTNFDYFLL